MSLNYESTLIENLAKIEKEFPTQNICYNGVYVWPLLKVKLYFELWHKYNSQGKDSSSPTIVKKILSFIKNGLRLFFSDFSKNSFRLKTDVLIFADPFNRRVEVGGAKYEIYSDPVYDSLLSNNHKPLVIERNSASEYPAPRYSSSLPQLILLPSFTLYFFRKTSLNDETKNLIKQIQTSLESKGYSAEALEERSVSKFLKIYNIHLEMYSFLLKLTKAKVIFLTEWYSIASMACIVAAKKLAVRTVELQHGVQTQAHIAYGNWLTVPDKNFTTPFPDYFWVWTPEDKKNIDSVFSKYGATSFLGGNLYIEGIKKSKISLVGNSEFDRILAQTNSKICLLTLQPTYEVNASVLNFLDKNKSAYFFLIRLHPIMLNKKVEIENFIKKNIPSLNFEIDLASSLPLLLLLKHSSLHATFNSSVVIEADAMNVPSLVFDEDMAPQYFKGFIDSRRCFVYTETFEMETNLKIDKNSEIAFEDISKLMV